MTITEVLYISSVPSAEQFSLIRQKQKTGRQHVTYGMPESGFKFHTLLLNGLASHRTVSVTSICGRSLSNQIHSGLYWKGVKEVANSGFKIVHLPVVNIRFLKQIFASIYFIFSVLSWRMLCASNSKKVVIFDGTYISAFPPVFLALTGMKIKKIGIFCDVYSFMADVEDAGRTKNTFQNLMRKISSFYYSLLDGMVLLSRNMDSAINPKHKPHILIEGIADGSLRSSGKVTKASTPTIVYAGALRQEYGLQNLINSFQHISNPNIRLVLYGEGNYKSKILEAAVKDPRISWGGLINQDEVFEKEQKAWVVINPRSAKAEFTKYSFPSKTMEYLASGSVVLMAKLPGIPLEYDKFLKYCNMDSPEVIAEAINNLISLGIDELSNLGSSGKLFVLNEKNNQIQSKRLLKFVEGL